MFLAEEDTTADAFCFCVSLGGRSGFEDTIIVEHKRGFHLDFVTL